LTTKNQNAHKLQGKKQEVPAAISNKREQKLVSKNNDETSPDWQKHAAVSTLNYHI
jgi:hypothetical protein